MRKEVEAYMKENGIENPRVARRKLRQANRELNEQYEHSRGFEEDLEDPLYIHLLEEPFAEYSIIQREKEYEEERMRRWDMDHSWDDDYY